MTPLRLTTWFKKRMLPLVAAAAAIVAAAAPIAYYAEKRLELLGAARGEAARVAEVVKAAVEERPRMWRYDAIKLGERLATEGLDRRPLRIVSEGMEVRVEQLRPPAPPRTALWGRHDLRLPPDLLPADVPPGFAEGGVVASVWVAVDGAPLYRGTALLALVFALLAAGLGTVLYLLPVRAIAGAERRAHNLLSRLALTLQEEDRRAIARDLHDGAGQAITAARLELLALAATAPAQAEAVKRITSHLDEALGEVRRSTDALGPPALAELGFARALQRHCEAFGDATGIRVRCEVAPDLPPLGGELELACYRIVQEALTNTARHARARAAAVRVGVEGEARRRALVLRVLDDGVGLGEEPARGRGLPGMRERARLLDGELALGPGEDGRGLGLVVRFPLEAAT